PAIRWSRVGKLMSARPALWMKISMTYSRSRKRRYREPSVAALCARAGDGRLRDGDVTALDHAGQGAHVDLVVLAAFVGDDGADDVAHGGGLVVGDRLQLRQTATAQ